VPGSFGCCLVIAVTKFHDKFASLRHVKGSSSQDKFQMCCTDMYSAGFFHRSQVTGHRSQVTSHRSPKNMPKRHEADAYKCVLSVTITALF